MPYLELKVTQTLDAKQKQAVVTGFGSIITLISGKTEAVTMVNVQDNAELYMNGILLDPGAYLEVDLFGQCVLEEKEAFAEAAFELLVSQLDIPATAVYMTFNEHEEWGSKGTLVHK